MSLFSGTRLTDKDIDVQTQKRIRSIVQRLWHGTIQPEDSIRVERRTPYQTYRMPGPAQ